MQITYLKQSNNHKKIKNYRNRNYQFDSSFYSTYFLTTTTWHYNHMGEAINLVDNFKAEKVIFNCGEFNDLKKELIKVLHKKKIKYYSCIKELNIDSNQLYFLQTKVYDNENDTVGIIICKQDNKYVIKYCSDDRIIAREYELV